MLKLDVVAYLTSRQNHRVILCRDKFKYYEKIVENDKKTKN